MFARETRIGSGAYTVTLFALLHVTGLCLTYGIMASVKMARVRSLWRWWLAFFWSLRTPFTPYIPALHDALFTANAERTARFREAAPT